MKKPLALLAAVLLSACPGSGSGPEPLPDPYEGTAGNDTLATAYAFPGSPIVAAITAMTDSDYFAFTVPPGGATVRFQTFDGSGASCDLADDGVDTFVEVFEPGGTRVTWSDDSGINRCEDFTWTLPAGTNYVAVSGYPPYPFAYTLAIGVP